jgi:hypothetical protein
MVSEQEAGGGKKKSAPEWATQPFRDFLERTERIVQLTDLSKKGISMLRNVPKIVEVLAEVEKGSAEEDNYSLERAKKEAELAQREVDEDFPLLHAQATIALWSALESAIRLFIVKWLQNYKEAMEVEIIQKLRVRIGDYERLEGEDRFFYILDRLDQELSDPFKNGITRFELLLEPFGMSGAVNENVKRDLFELNHVRNSLVHRSGLVDRRIVDSCPWLKLKIGGQIKIDGEMWHKYFTSVMKYVTELIVRLGEQFGVDMSKFRGK